jgi:hypothetical protein
MYVSTISSGRLLVKSGSWLGTRECGCVLVSSVVITMTEASGVYLAACERRSIKPNSAIANLLEREASPRSLQLSNNYCGTENGFDCFLEALKVCPDVESLDLNDNHLTTENVTALCETLLRHPNVLSLSLCNNRLYIESGMQLVRLARFNPGIAAIDVTDEVDSPTANHIPDRIVRKIHAQVNLNRSAMENDQ